MTRIPYPTLAGFYTPTIYTFQRINRAHDLRGVIAAAANDSGVR
jgi:hypothetical protein